MKKSIVDFFINYEKTALQIFFTKLKEVVVVVKTLDCESGGCEFQYG